MNSMSDKSLFYINIDNVKTIQVVDKTISKAYGYLEEGRFLWFITQEEGFYELNPFASMSPIYLGKDPDLGKSKIIDDKVVYHKPHIKVKFINEDDDLTLFFNTLKDANLAAEKITKSEEKFIKIEE